MKAFAFFRLSERVSSYIIHQYRLSCLAICHTCFSSQHRGPVFHFGPQIPISFSRTSSSGSFASPLSTHGSREKRVPQSPRIAHRPASWMGVKASLDTRVEAAVRRPATARRLGPIVALKRRPAPQFLVVFIRQVWSKIRLYVVERA